MEKDWLFIDNELCQEESKNIKKCEINKKIDSLVNESVKIQGTFIPKLNISKDVLNLWRKKLNLIPPKEDLVDIEMDYKIDILEDDFEEDESKNIDTFNNISKNFKLIYQNYKKNKFLWNSVVFTSVILYCKLSSLNDI